MQTNFKIEFKNLSKVIWPPFLNNNNNNHNNKNNYN